MVEVATRQRKDDETIVFRDTFETRIYTLLFTNTQYPRALIDSHLFVYHVNVLIGLTVGTFTSQSARNAFEMRGRLDRAKRLDDKCARDDVADVWRSHLGDENVVAVRCLPKQSILRTPRNRNLYNALGEPLHVSKRVFASLFNLELLQ